MWQVDNRTPFAAERGWVRDRNGAEVWLVAVKCTFDIRPDGSTEVSKDQPPVLRVPEHLGEPGTSSIKFDNDLVLAKKTTDIIVVGHAHAPGGRPVTEMEVGFRVGPVQKTLRVTGDREWGTAGRSAPVPFVKMPLTYERGFGGADRRSPSPERDFDWRNPVGTGFAVSRDNVSGVALPNVEYPGELVRSWNDRPRPAGFGAIAGHWQPRVGFAGTYDDNWMKTRQPLLPDDFDDRYFQCAPQDQQAPAFLRGGEAAALLGLTPNGEARFDLPKVFLGFDTRFYDGSREIHKERKLHTVIIDADHPRVSLVWHTALPCHFKPHKLELTVVTLKTDVTASEQNGRS
ncbi:MAG TPA: DUF2169 domain-containing protein [Gemmatimonadales bacterium]|nr:DUF2169 domain-containing protein [Gemmatimonadales bacterium]